MTVLVDSDILIEVTRGRDEGVLSRWRELARSDAAVLCSAVSVAELWAGARTSEHSILNELFEAMTCVVVDAETGRAAGAYLRQYGKSHGVHPGDALVAASASAHEALLWTRNQKRYPMKDVTFY